MVSAVRRLVVSLVLGAAYGLLALKIASPLAVPLTAFIVLLPVLAWRLHYEAPRLASVAATFVVGFAVVWTIVVVPLAIQCQPPSCTWAGASWTFVQGALILLAPAILVGGTAAVGRLVTRSRSGRGA